LDADTATAAVAVQFDQRDLELAIAADRLPSPSM
jgi:hypothetical protein